jgi:WD40 repeat protein
MILRANKDNTYKLTLFNQVICKYFSVEIILREEEMLNNENVLHRIDEKLKTLPTLIKVENIIKLYYNTLSESIKINNKEILTLMEEIKLQFREHSESRFKVNKVEIFKAINDFDNYVRGSFDSLINKMSLYKDVLMSLGDDKVSNWLKESFCCFYNDMSNEFGYHKNMKELLTEYKTKEEHLSQTIKELKDEIMRQKSKENTLIQTIKELKEEIEELNKSYNDNYKALYQTVNNLNENIKAIKISLEESKQRYNSKLALETQNLTCCNKMLVNSQINIEENLLNKIELFPEEKLRTIKTSVIIGEHENKITSMISLPNNYIATTSLDKTIKIWDLSKYILVKTLEGHTDQIYCIALLSDGNIASGSYDRTIKIWDSKNDYKCINTLNGHTHCVKCLLVLKNGNLVSGSWDKCIKVWDCKSYICIKTIKHHTYLVNSLIKLTYGFYASGSGDSTIKIWDANNECVNIIIEDNQVCTLLLLSEGNIVSGTKTIKVWKCENDYKDTQCIIILKGHTDYIYTLYLVNYDYILSGSRDTTIKVWDIKNEYQCINTLNEHNEAVSSLFILNNNQLISSSWDKTIRLWN